MSLSKEASRLKEVSRLKEASRLKEMSLSKEEEQILGYLLDKYERSATFRGQSSRNQSFSLRPEDLFPKYADEREYDFFVEINRRLRELREGGLIETQEINQRITKVTLCFDPSDPSASTGKIYRILGREPKRELLRQLSALLAREKAYIETNFPGGDLSEALLRYIAAQEERMEAGKLPEYYEDGRPCRKGTASDTDYRDLWKVFRGLQSVTEDVYIRNLSIRLFHDSKRLESLSGKVEACLYRYGDYPEKGRVLEECNVMRAPSYVMVRGPVVLEIAGQTLDAGRLAGDIAFSTKSLKDISGIRVAGKRVITVENLTSFHSNDYGEDALVLYLGGYHNAAKRLFLRKVYEANPGAEYYHFGDIDAGGFYIYEHLRRKTGIPFKTMMMGAQTLKKYKEYTKPLTAHDTDRLRSLIRKYETGELRNPDKDGIVETLEWMLKNGRKLEQEALEWKECGI